MNLNRSLLVVALLFGLTFSVQNAEAQEPDWYPYVIARGNDRQAIENTPILERPYRPFHFYGNTVRRSHFRGNPVPLPRDWARTVIEVTVGRRR